MRNRVELPGESACDDVVSAEIAGRRHVAFARGRSQEDQVLEDAPRRPRLDARDRLAPEALAQIDDALGAEREDGLSRRRIDLLEVVVHRKDQPPILAILALPVVHAARCHSRHAVVDPDLFSALRVEGNDGAIASAPVDRAAHDDRIGSGLAERIGPGDRQPVDVRFVDTSRAKEPGAVSSAGVIRPPEVV